MEQIVTDLLMTQICKFKAKDSEVVAALLFLGNILRYWPVDYMEKTELSGHVYDFSAPDDRLDIHKYLMKKNNMI